MKTSPTNKKVRELIGLVTDKKLLPRPEFQRRLVWSRDNKNSFLDSVLRNYPFPEIYVADGDVDLETGEGTQLLVDGQQRVTTLIQYFRGDPELKLTIVPAYRELLEEGKKAFLQYDVAVRDLGAVSREEIIEVFKRINATSYSLIDIEINNAVYAGAMKSFAERVSEHTVFQTHRVFDSRDLKRMGDLRFALSLLISFIQGYFNRDDAFEEYLSRYNDEFPLESELSSRFDSVVSFIDECGFDNASRVWRKADLFTLMIELDQQINAIKKDLQPSVVVEQLTTFYESIGGSDVGAESRSAVYYKATVQASNDRLNRVRRGIIIGSILEGKDNRQTMKALTNEGLI